MTKTLTALLLVAGVLSGCTMAPRYERPEAPVAGGYPAAPEGYAAAEVKSGETRRATEIGWREFFRDARLQALIAAALENNRDLRTAALRIEEARAQYSAARRPAAHAECQGGLHPPALRGGAIGHQPALCGAVLRGRRRRRLVRAGLLRPRAPACPTPRWRSTSPTEARRAAQVSRWCRSGQGHLSTVPTPSSDLAADTLKTRQDTYELSKQRFAAGATSALDLRDNESLVARGTRVGRAAGAPARAGAERAGSAGGQTDRVHRRLPAPMRLSDERIISDIRPGCRPTCWNSVPMCAGPSRRCCRPTPTSARRARPSSRASR